VLQKTNRTVEDRVLPLDRPPQGVSSGALRSFIAQRPLERSVRRHSGTDAVWVTGLWA
jgi:hypothetical protein